MAAVSVMLIRCFADLWMWRQRHRCRSSAMNATEKVANSAGIAKSATGTGSSFHPHNKIYPDVLIKADQNDTLKRFGEPLGISYFP